MKFIAALFLTAILSFVAGQFLPWWTIAPVAAGIGVLIPQKPLKSFFSGFLGVFLLWLGLTLWIDRSNGGLLSARMAQVLPLGGQVLFLHGLTAVVGGLIAGLAGLSGKYARAALTASSR